jgi:hypothetical protein
MKNTLTLAAAVAVALLSGCSAIQQGDQYSSASLPTAASVAQAGGEQRYNDTLFKTADFKADGSVRAFGEYNFASESAPCTALGDGYKGASFNSSSSFYEVEKGGEKYLFNCRAVQNGPTPAMRLFLIGSSADCAARTGNSGQFGQLTVLSKQVDQMCNGYRISGGKQTKVDMSYTQS